MVFFEKSQPAPDSLTSRTSYREEDVIERLESDFKNKCYICGFKNPVSINVEHFIPHRGDEDLMFDWNNLFYSCSHCNNTKEMLERNTIKGGFLNCTCGDDKVDERISYRVNSFPELKVLIEEVPPVDKTFEERVNNTITLLKAVYDGYNTPIKKREAANLRIWLMTEIIKFQKLLIKLSSSTVDSEQVKEEIEKELSNESAFTAFKRWIVKDSSVVVQSL